MFFIDLNSEPYRIVNNIEESKSGMIQCNGIDDEIELIFFSSHRVPDIRKFANLIFNNYTHFKIFKRKKFEEVIHNAYNLREDIAPPLLVKLQRIFKLVFSEENSLGMALKNYVEENQFPYNKEVLTELCWFSISMNQLQHENAIFNLYKNLTNRHAILLMNIVRELLIQSKRVRSGPDDLYSGFRCIIEDIRSFSPVLHWAMGMLTKKLIFIPMYEDLSYIDAENNNFISNLKTVYYVDGGIRFINENGYYKHWEKDYIHLIKRQAEAKERELEGQERRNRQEREKERERAQFQANLEKEMRKRREEKRLEMEREAKELRDSYIKSRCASSGAGGRVRNSFGAKNFNIERIYGNIICEPWNMRVSKEDSWYLVNRKMKKDCKRKRPVKE